MGGLPGFIARDLSEVGVEYLFGDAIFESLRRQGAKEALLVAWCIDTEGRKHLLHLAVGNKESEAAWTEFFRNMVARGLRMPTTVTTDGAPGMIKAVDVVFERTVRIRCWFHRLANIRAKLPNDAAPEVMAHLYAVRDAPTLDAARAAADRFENTFAKQFPSAVACFPDDREALLAIHRVPVRHRIRVRTTNLAERGFEEERRRTKVIPRLMSEQATMKLAFATMIRAAERWCRVSINDLERHQLKLLRIELGLDPPPPRRPNQPTKENSPALRGMRLTPTDLQDAQDLPSCCLPPLTSPRRPLHVRAFDQGLTQSPGIAEPVPRDRLSQGLPWWRG